MSVLRMPPARPVVARSSSGDHATLACVVKSSHFGEGNDLPSRRRLDGAARLGGSELTGTNGSLLVEEAGILVVTWPMALVANRRGTTAGRRPQIRLSSEWNGGVVRFGAPA